MKKKQATVFVEFPTRANKENLPQTQKKRNHNDSRKVSKLRIGNLLLLLNCCHGSQRCTSRMK